MQKSGAISAISGFMRLIFLLLIAANLTVRGESLEWFTDAAAAQTKARAENKLVMLDFTGSDWCSWCIKLKREVFDQAEFAEFAQSRLVPVEVNFPRHQTLPEAQQQANDRLKRTFGITGFPTIILLNSNGERVGRMGYVAGGPAAFIARLEQVAKLNKPVVHKAPAHEPEKLRKPVVWTPPPAPVPIHYGPLALKSISGTKEHPVVLINNATLMVGESAKVRAEDREVVVSCKEVRDDSVSITCDGKPMELKLGSRNLGASNP